MFYSYREIDTQTPLVEKSCSAITQAQEGPQSIDMPQELDMQDKQPAGVGKDIQTRNTSHISMVTGITIFILPTVHH